MNGSGSVNDGFNAQNPVDKFEEAFMSCLSALTKEDTLTNVDREEIRVDVEQGIYNVIESARSMEAYFLKKRLEISTQKPELLIKDDANELRLELIRKDDLLKKNYEKINHWQSILSDVQAATTTGKQGTPGQHVPPTGLSQQLSQAPHTPQGPMTPTGGRPNTPGGAGRPQTPGGGVRMQTSSIGRSVIDEIHSSYHSMEQLNLSEDTIISIGGKRKIVDKVQLTQKRQKTSSLKGGNRKISMNSHGPPMTYDYSDNDMRDSSGDTITAIVVHKKPSKTTPRPSS